MSHHGHTHVNLDDVEDVAAKHGLGHRWEARAARTALDAAQTGVMHIRLHPGQRSPFAHKHVQAEEIYVVLSGSGQVKLGAEFVVLGNRDAVRISPEVSRAFEAGPEGLELLVFGPHHPGDGEMVEDDWTA
jgi:mannose-6-phosphate isomerase-like protein (cupin superfamily)